MWKENLDKGSYYQASLGGTQSAQIQCDTTRSDIPMDVYYQLILKQCKVEEYVETWIIYISFYYKYNVLVNFLLF